MKILCVIDSLGSGGAQKQLVELAKGFHEVGHDVSFLTYHQFDFFKEELLQHNINIHCIVEPNYLKRLWKMRSFIRKGNYDAVLSFLEASSFICELAGLPFRKWKLIVGERSANPNIKESFKLKFYRWFHLLSDFVVSNSNTNRDIVKSVNPLLPQKKLKVIYNLVDIGNNSDHIQPIPKQENEKLVLLVAAGQREVKNLSGLIEAVNTLTEAERAKLSIHWYGDEADSSYSKAVVKIQNYKLEGNFFFYKATQDIKSKMLAADLIGLFSFYEGFPNTICEAMSLGKPVICSSVSDVPLIINNDRYLFNPNKTDEIAKVLSYVLKLNSVELETIGKTNKEIANSLFNKEQIVSQYLNLMQ
ncbi:glycosyltransferase [Albibacterium sp.]|uniref:glycosyltransferase n=1 Tax=Albibacterium sp. TaxID=2952885 RepID=UPI002B52BD13|nr:glycosyltransferase [Albibacterium sp.]HUH18943.1 glycosyltransferase [Albibacterium sp.]